MLAVIGTVPEKDFPLIEGEAYLRGEHLHVGDQTIAINRGTPALLAAATITAQALGLSVPYAYLAGDIGRGHGSRLLYEYLTHQLPGRIFSALAFHYLQPIVRWHSPIIKAIESMAQRPKLIADAGFMYMAKMSGQSQEYDLFTPDVGELAFLADEEAPHPFYTRGFILQEEERVPQLIQRAYQYNNAAQTLLVKGRQDYLATRDNILDTVDSPSEAAMEAMGGTGDTLTGIAAVLIASGMDVNRAAVTAARINRHAGALAMPNPATQVIELIRCIPPVLSHLL